MLNLDTHILIYALTDQLTAKEKKILSNDQWSVSSIVLWEITKLFQLGRINLDFNDSNVIRAMSKIQIWPIDFNICKAILSLDFKGDPADEIIAATSLFHQLPLVTRDQKIKKSKKIPLAQ